jgi:hypothetical protein
LIGIVPLLVRGHHQITKIMKKTTPLAASVKPYYNGHYPQRSSGKKLPSPKEINRLYNSSPSKKPDLYDPEVEIANTAMQAVKIQPSSSETEILTIADLKSARNHLYNVRRKWYDIGIELEIPIETLDTIRDRYDSYGVCLIEMIKEWLNSEQATWKALAEALRAKPVNERKLAYGGEC